VHPLGSVGVASSRDRSRQASPELIEGMALLHNIYSYSNYPDLI